MAACIQLHLEREVSQKAVMQCRLMPLSAFDGLQMPMLLEGDWLHEMKALNCL